MHEKAYFTKLLFLNSNGYSGTLVVFINGSSGLSSVESWKMGVCDLGGKGNFAYAGEFGGSEEGVR